MKILAPKILAPKISAPATLLLCIALAPLPAAAGPQENQAACMNDAMTICSQFIPDRERVADLPDLKFQPRLGSVPRCAHAF